ncbi:pentatricopeptide repeat-containing protein At5g61800 [Vitis riparia]|uniref:pentatricopeptide repeat-containing protein At5g61800 n=1 Tax=Vitis riparia TaxID=96939 RepID=UPI00155AAA03|nr:pentatricopeptide repeat-containing protein At5g61800 [Vitis riparia]
MRKEDGSDGNTIVNTSEAINAIRQCKSLKQLHQVHAHTITTGLSRGLHHSSLLLTNILTAFTALLPTTNASPTTPAALTGYALSVFNRIPNPSTFGYNTMIRAHTLLSSPLAALVIFVRMRRLSVPPDTHTFPFCLKACSLLPALSLAQTLHSQAFKFGFGADLFVCNTLIHVYSVNKHLHHACQVFNETSLKDVVSYNALIGGFIKVGDTDRARRLFDEMPIRDAVSWGTLLAGYAQSGDLCMDAIQLFNRMLISTVRPDNIALVSALSACAQLGELEQGKSIHVYIKQNRIPINAFLSTGLVDLYAKCGCIETAREIFESSPDKNLFTWNALLVGLGMHGRGHLSLHYFSRMIEAGIKPDGVSFLGILVGCGHAGLVCEARKFFQEMEVVYRVPRELKHYGCMADLLGRAGLIREAMEMIERMPMGGDVFVWGGVLGGCRIHGNVEIAEKAAENVMALNPEDDGVYSIMADIYANAGRWEDVARIRRLMHSRQVKKNPGCSLVQLN